MKYLRRLSKLVEKIPRKIRYTLGAIHFIILVILIFEFYGPKYELIAESGYENRYIEIYQNMNDYKELRFKFGDCTKQDSEIQDSIEENLNHKLNGTKIEFNWYEESAYTILGNGYSKKQKLHLVEVAFNQYELIVQNILIDNVE